MTADRTHAIDPEALRRLGAVLGRPPSFIAKEVAQRMASRLDYIRIEPKEIIDSHSRPAGDWTLLRERFAGAHLIALQSAAAQFVGTMPTQAQGLARLKQWFAADHWLCRLCADLGSIPLRSGTADMLWSNLAVHWHPEPHRMFPEWHRALKVGGLVLFSAFGPDTLREVRHAFQAIDRCAHVLDFTDMHDYGDMLVASGFATPVMDMETITLTYASVDKLWEDVRALGGNPLVQRRRGLIGRADAGRLTQALDDQRGPDGRLRLTIEVVYGHAWKAEPRPRPGAESVLRRIDRPPSA
jgi:malonyl-CoA O-methyltransferase